MINRITDFVKRNKRKILLASFILFFIAMLFVPNRKQEDNLDNSVQVNEKIEDEGFLIEDNNKKITRTSDELPYLMNRFDVLDGVLGFTWSENRIIYATSNGIHELVGNKQLFEKEIDNVYFSKNLQRLVYKDKGNYYFLDYAKNIEKEVEIESSEIKIDSNLNHILYSKDNDLYLFETNSETHTLMFSGIEEKDYDWLLDQNKFYVVQDKYLEVFDSQQQKTASVEIPSDERFLSVSPDVRYLITASFNKNQLNLKDVNTGKSKSVAFEKIDEIKVYWKSNNELLVIEKRDRGIKDLYDQYIWVVDINGTRKYISNTQPMANKIDTSIDVTINNSSTAFAVKENKGKLWVFSLVPGLLPTFDEKGLVLYNLPNTNRQDNH